MCAPRSSQHLTQQAFFLAHQLLCTPSVVEVPKDAFDITFNARASPISNTGSPFSSSGSDVAMCPLVAGLTGSGDGTLAAPLP